MRTELVLRFDYGSVVPWVTRTERRHACAPSPGRTWSTLARRSTCAARTCARSASSTSRQGERQVRSCLSYVALAPADTANAGSDAGRCASTEAFWRAWAERCGRGDGEWSEAVLRSLITLKALTYAPTGGIVAAPTTSLPEQLGGARNWDYRFCWLRDATLTLYGADERRLRRRGGAWRDWLLRAVAGSPDQMQIMYGLAGERRLTECEVPWLPGYEGSRPVRIGNAAHGQLQLDVYGEVLDALAPGAARRPRARRARLGAAARAARAPRDGLERAGRGHLGGAGAARSTSPTRR